MYTSCTIIHTLFIVMIGYANLHSGLLCIKVMMGCIWQYSKNINKNSRDDKDKQTFLHVSVIDFEKAIGLPTSKCHLYYFVQRYVSMQ